MIRKLVNGRSIKSLFNKVVAFIAFSMIVTTCTATTFYYDYIDKAQEYFANEKYEVSGNYYDSAFFRWEGYQEHLYEASRSWVYAGDKEKGYEYILKAIDRRFYDSQKLINDEKYINGLGTEYSRLVLAKMKEAEEVFNEGINDSLKKVLIGIRYIDQELRLGKNMKRIETYYEKEKNCDEYKKMWEVINYIDSLNLVKFTELYNIYGWPHISLVGEEGNKAAWHVIQHSDSKTQQKFLPIIKKSCEQGETPWKWYGYVHDRIISWEKGKVKFGCSLYYDENTDTMRMEAQNKSCINYWREQIGLRPMNQYRVYEPCKE